MTTADEEREFYANMLGIDGQGHSINELKSRFFQGVADGSVVIGGEVDPGDVQVVVDTYLSENPPSVSPTGLMPTIFADSSTTFASTRAAFIAANFPGYTGPVCFNSAKYLDHPAPVDYQAWDFWLRRRTV